MALTAVAVVLLAVTGSTPTLSRVRLHTEDAAAITPVLEGQGFDVLEGSTRATSLDLMVSDDELQRLRTLGHTPVILGRGQALQRRAPAGTNATPTGYPTLAEINAALESAAASFPDIAKVVDL